MGTPEFAAETLEALAGDEEIEVPLVITQPDSKSGRKMKLTPSAVKKKAIELGLKVETPQKVSTEEYIKKFQEMNLDAVLVLAYGQLLKQSLLDSVKDKFINIHASLLPKWRGAAPIQRAIMNGDEVTGVSFQIMRLKLDAGPVVFEKETRIEPNENSLELANRLSKISANLVCDVMKDFIKGKLQATAQDEDQVSYAHKISKAEGHIDWSKKAVDLHNQIRGLKWGPGAFTHFNEKRLKISQTSVDLCSNKPPGEVCVVENEEKILVGTGEGLLVVEMLQPEGKPPMSIKDFINGYGLTEGQRFS